jgi:geranylgeranyl pyrophosphate synthase
MPLEQLLEAYADRVEKALDRFLPSPDVEPVRLHAAMRYATLGGGKRIRAALVYATGEALDAKSEHLDAAAGAVELIHAFSLVHDDLPSMDDDDLRRGRPTCHRQFDEATALLAGDALQTLAFEVLASSDVDPAIIHSRLAMVKMLATASGSNGMAGGQALDIEATGQSLELEQLIGIHELKTGALIHAAVMFGALAAEEETGTVHDNLDQFGRCIGLAGSDLAANKATFPAIMGLQAARERANSLLETALASLEPLGDNGRSLADLARFIVHRHY